MLYTVNATPYVYINDNEVCIFYEKLERLLLGEGVGAKLTIVSPDGIRRVVYECINEETHNE